MAAGLIVAGIATASGIGTAQAADISGTVTFADNAVVPKGHIKIFLETHASQKSTQELTREVQLKSSGKSKAITFSFSKPTTLTDASVVLIVARLERADGWLLARGSAMLKANTATDITLYKAMY
ncbi:hypothetical protein PsAD2_03106 [Pseudovibrio axinellae]|uniref:Uncharacterized protein n=1 Tax=Pseudovibrio axinellae TaxID=989403 RepID=A0A165XCH4_9HYPH|nr:hypothetical protein PsAD2_03106 [Pseudovibrio axinellae]SER32372.1 hypothetical protein SAMN05421798_10844 [Pseudovibrio axinellae]